MDIDLLWAIGGWYWFLIPDCMATLKTSISESSSKSSHPFLLFVGLIFIFFVLVHSSDPSNPSMASKQTVVPHGPSASVSSTTMNLHHRKSQNSQTSSSREFEAGAHEVPSGPNPISN